MLLLLKKKLIKKIEKIGFKNQFFNIKKLILRNKNVINISIFKNIFSNFSIEALS